MSPVDPKALKAAGFTPAPEPVLGLVYCELLPVTPEQAETKQRAVRIKGYGSGKTVILKVPENQIASQGFTLIPRGQTLG